MNRVAGALLFGLNVIGLVLALAYQRFSTYLPARRPGLYHTPEPSTAFPIWGWGLIAVGFVFALALLVDRRREDRKS